MLQYLIRRIILFVPVLAAMAIISFLLVRSAPGSPFTTEKGIPESTLKQLEKEYGLDKPLPVQLGMYLKNLSRGFLGRSTKYKDRTVNEIIAQALPVSLKLGTLALILALLLGIPLGLFSAYKQNGLVDYMAMGTAMMGISIPSFVLASLLVLVFSFMFPILPAAGWFGIKHLILPAFTLAVPFVAYISRILRSSIIDVLKQDYIKTARAKGVSEISILFKHALQNGILPVISFLGPAAAGILTGSVVVEKIFAIPGMGTNFIHSALHRDHFLAVGLALVYGALLLLFNLTSDVLYGVVDPRIKYDEK